jgi:FtsH-binding integral membrane protein
MSELDNRLAAALNADPPPERDARFRVEVLLRIERAQFKQRVLRTLAVAFAAAVLVAMNTQAIEAWIVTDIWHVWIVALSAAAAMLFFSNLPIEAVPGLRGLARTLTRWLYP